MLLPERGVPRLPQLAQAWRTQRLSKLEDILAVRFALEHLKKAWAARAWKLGKMGNKPAAVVAAANIRFCTEPFEEVGRCRVDHGREKQTIVSDLDGSLLRSRSSFPYFMLIAFEAGSPLRSVILLLASPIIWVVYHLVSEAAGIKILIFLSLAGLKVSVIESVARGVLPKFYLEDMHSVSYKVFTSCGKRYIVTANPRIMVEPFLKDYLSVEAVMGTELEVTRGGYATGFVTGPGVLVGSNKERAVKKYFGDDLPDVALGDRPSDFPFMNLCKVSSVLLPSCRSYIAARTAFPLFFLSFVGRASWMTDSFGKLPFRVW